MPHEAAHLTRREVIEFARSHGISAEQLHRWTNLSLLPKPVIKGFGRGASTEARFPTEATKTRLLEIAKALEQDRDIAALQWRLWWKGAEVATDRVRRSLVRTVEATQKQRRSSRARQTDDDAWVRFDQTNRRPLGDESALASLQKRMDKGSFVQLKKSLLEITSGTLDKREIEKARSAFRQVLGPVVLSLDFVVISDLSNPDDWRTALDRTSNDGLEVARQELQATIAQFADMCAKEPAALVGYLPFPVSVCALMLSIIGEGLPRELFLIWLSCRQHPEFRTLFQALIKTLQWAVSDRSKGVPPNAAGLP